jgi:hypothetical protein
MTARTHPAFVVVMIIVTLWAAFVTLNVPRLRPGMNRQVAHTRTHPPAIPVNAVSNPRATLFRWNGGATAAPIQFHFLAGTIVWQRLSRPVIFASAPRFSLRI